MKMLSFSTYLFETPRHGGQVRLNAIHTVLRSKGWTTQNLAVYTPNFGDSPGSNEWPFAIDSDFNEFLQVTKGRTDVDAAEFILKRSELFDDASARIDEFDPDIFWLEQPWLWPLVVEYKRSRPSCRAKIVYGSQNVEVDLIKNVLGNLSREAAEKVIDRVRKIEDDLCVHADAIIGVSKADLSRFRHFNKPTELFENGVWPRGASSGIDYWRKELRNLSTLLFVGSAHPPNAAGFRELLGDNLSYLAPDERIIVLGSVGGLIEKPEFYPENRGLNLSRLISIGVQDSGGLSTMIEMAKGIILPICEGGGTNLKTAEALYNRKRIVATSTAMRGFEEFSEFPGVAISDTKEGFVANMKRVLTTDTRATPRYSDEQIRLSDSLIWTSRLKTLPNFLTELSGKVHAQHTSPVDRDSNEKDSYFNILTPAMLRPFLGQGWHDFERQGTWSKDNFAVLKLEMNKLARKSVFVAAFVEFYVPRSQKVQLDIYTPSGYRSSYLFSRATRKQVININLLAEDFYEDGETEIYFESSILFRPSEHSKSPDERKIGFRFSKLHIGSSLPTQSSAMVSGNRVGGGRLSGLFRRAALTRLSSPRS